MNLATSYISKVLKETDLQDLQSQAIRANDRTLNRCIGKASFMSRHKGISDVLCDMPTRL